MSLWAVLGSLEQFGTEALGVLQVFRGIGGTGLSQYGVTGSCVGLCVVTGVDKGEPVRGVRSLANLVVSHVRRENRQTIRVPTGGFNALRLRLMQLSQLPRNIKSTSKKS